MIHLPVRTIGLTGGIACGKSMVSEYLACQCHCKVLDADLYARDAVTPPSSILDAIQSRYGGLVLNHDGELDRKRLGQIIFSDALEREWLEHQIHPFVRQCLIQGRERYLSRPQGLRPLIMVIPLLFESQMEDLVTDIWVVSCSPEQQRQRLMVRNRLSLAQAEERIASQWPLVEKMKCASVIIDNAGDRAQTYRQIDQALNALDIGC